MNIVCIDPCKFKVRSFHGEAFSAWQGNSPGHEVFEVLLKNDDPVTHFPTVFLLVCSPMSQINN